MRERKMRDYGIVSEWALRFGRNLRHVPNGLRRRRRVRSGLVGDLLQLVWERFPPLRCKLHMGDLCCHFGCGDGARGLGCLHQSGESYKELLSNRCVSGGRD